MKNTTKMSGCAVFTALTLVLLASSPLVAGQPTVSFGVTGVGNGGSLDSIYTSPYAGTVNGTATPIICDDFANNSYVPEYYTAYVTSLSSINNGTDTPGDLKWNNAVSGGTVDGYAAWNLDQKLAYDVAAYLAIEIVQSPAASTASKQLSYALWELFDATSASSSNLPSNGDNVVSWLTTTNPDSTTLSAATTDVENAISAVCAGACTANMTTHVESVTGTPTVLNGESVNIYTITQPVTCTSPCSTTNPPQEFITVTVPEGVSPAVFVVYLLLGGASWLIFGRRRISASR